LPWLYFGGSSWLLKDWSKLMFLETVL